ncbi:MAG TPA: ATP-binding protein [Gammaproteobacteria bacterium]|nr:ATP-binding protein [Gammaproteobacteria bacterium]
MFNRLLGDFLEKTAAKFPVIVLTGPRQSGKTTLLRSLFPTMEYCLLEAPDVIDKIQSDPRGYFNLHLEEGIIFDEIQNLPEIFSYIQEYVDAAPRPKQFILSGSQNFLLLEQISQSLAGRCAILELLPLSYQEFLTQPSLKQYSVWEYLYFGSYPRPYKEKLDHRLWYQSYTKTYIERDVRQIINIKDTITFHRFLKLCAGRHAQLLNLASLAIDAGISLTTAKMWISLLETSYIVFLLRPYHKNFNKRLIKTPKLYFYDSGLVSYLLEIDSPQHLSMHSARGGIFEGFVISEIIKSYYHAGKIPNIYFWRDYRGDEVDCIIERGNEFKSIEIKSTQTLTQDIFNSLLRWQEITTAKTNGYLVYAGNKKQQTIKGICILNWENIPELT